MNNFLQELIFNDAARMENFLCSAILVGTLMLLFIITFFSIFITPEISKKEIANGIKKIPTNPNLVPTEKGWTTTLKFYNKICNANKNDKRIYFTHEQQKRIENFLDLYSTEYNKYEFNRNGEFKNALSKIYSFISNIIQIAFLILCSSFNIIMSPDRCGVFRFCVSFVILFAVWFAKTLLCSSKN